MEFKHVRIYINAEEIKLPVLDSDGNISKKYDVLKKETRLIEVVYPKEFNGERIVLADVLTGETYEFDRESILDTFDVLQIMTSCYDEEEFLK